jgi:hypothetical protein
LEIWILIYIYIYRERERERERERGKNKNWRLGCIYIYMRWIQVTPSVTQKKVTPFLDHRFLRDLTINYHDIIKN